jgi:hypothetical protein
MPATIEQAMSIPTTTAMMPTITHDAPNQIVTVYVVVTLNPDGQDITIAAAPVALLQGPWSVRWNLIVATPGLHAQFGDPGILIDAAGLPPRVSVGTILSQPDHCAAQVSNAAQSSNQFNYWISVTWMWGNSETMVKTVHDPTIAVTQDPVGAIIQPVG